MNKRESAVFFFGVLFTLLLIFFSLDDGHKVIIAPLSGLALTAYLVLRNETKILKNNK